ncbi:hypothetical protein DXG01_013696 [Tephrocybe rancida]|nr:hypothetical protein DXG01_013696 [Tephrocybe rancida]
MLSKGLDPNYFQEVFYYFESWLQALLLAVEGSDNAGRKWQFEVYLDLELDPPQIFTAAVIRELQGAPDHDDLTQLVSSYTLTWWTCKMTTKERLFSWTTALQCLGHHQKVTGIIPAHPHIPRKWLLDSVMDIWNEVNVQAMVARARTHHTSRQAAALFIIMNNSEAKWHARPVGYDGPDPSAVSLDGMGDVLDLDQDLQGGSGYKDSLPSPSGDGSVDQTAMEALTMFDNLSKDIIDPPPYWPQYYPIHFQHPPLGVPTFEAPIEHDVSSEMSQALRHMLTPLPDTDSSDDGNDLEVGIPGNGIIISDDDTEGDNYGDPSLIILSDCEVTNDDAENIVTISDDDV